ncbi:MAG TPA: hypothetical protein P5234_07215 [Thermoanaerobaculaceae bacterium]|nr:hypothetical protein [Thermoanaerobaculaceae bacterium]HRS16027.1 hypothetical protein [Thermoanaerobaculaceae bacterium]
MTPAEAARRLAASPLLRRLAGIVGSEAFLVGGGLRDRLLGLVAHDLDLVVATDPAGAARRVASALGGKAFPLGNEPLVTWRVVAGSLAVDLWRAERGLAEDIWRRDITVNALAWRLPRGPLVDLTGGLEDLAARRIRVVRACNFEKDPLRVLRAVRLMSTHPPFAMTAEAEGVVAAAAPALRAVARERVIEELRRLLAGPGAGKAVAVAARLGILAALSPAWADRRQAAEPARRAAALAAMQRNRRGFLAAGAGLVAPAVLALPAAGAPGGWDRNTAAATLECIGYPRRRATRVAQAAAFGEKLAASGSGWSELRELAWEAGELLPAALAWAAAADARWLDLASRLCRWQRRFALRPPLLDGEGVARLLALPATAERAEAVRALRLAQARGEVRRREAAVRFLRAWLAARGVDSTSRQC